MTDHMNNQPFLLHEIIIATYQAETKSCPFLSYVASYVASHKTRAAMQPPSTFMPISEFSCESDNLRQTIDLCVKKINTHVLPDKHTFQISVAHSFMLRQNVESNISPWHSKMPWAA